MKMRDVFPGRNLKSIDSAEFRAALTACIAIPRFQRSRMLLSIWATKRCAGTTKART